MGYTLTTSSMVHSNGDGWGWNGPVGVSYKGTVFTIKLGEDTFHIDRTEFVSVGGTPITGGQTMEEIKALITANFPDASTPGTGGGAFADITGFPNSNANLKKQLLPANKVLFPSQLGCTADADLEMFSDNAGVTDNTSAFEAIAAKTAPIVIVPEGAYGISQIRLRSNTRLSGLPGSGLVQVVDGNTKLIENKNPVSGTGTIIDENIIVENLIINGNGDFQTRGDEAYPTIPAEGYHYTLCLVGVRGGRVFNVEVRRAVLYGFFFTNVDGLIVDGCKVDQHYLGEGAGSPSIGPYGDLHNQDGFHVLGPASNVTLRNLTINSQDDNICIAANDVNYGPDGTAGGGLIQWSTIEKVTFVDSAQGIRLISTTNFLGGTKIKGLRGSLRQWAVAAHNFYPNGAALVGGVGAGNFGRLEIEDVDVSLSERFGETAICLFRATFYDEALLTRIMRRDFDAALPYPSFLFYGVECVMPKVVIREYAADQVDAADVKHVHVYDNAHIELLQIIDSSVKRDVSLGTEGCLVCIEDGGYVERLELYNVTTDGLENVVRVEADGQLDYFNGVSLKHLNADGGYTIYVASGVTIIDAYGSGFYGFDTDGGGGTILKKRGDMWADLPDTPPAPPGNYMPGFTAIPFPTKTAMTEVSPGIWQANDATASYAHTALSNLKLASGQDGAIGFKMPGGDIHGLLGFTTSNAEQSYTAWGAGMGVNPSPTFEISYLEGGGGNVTGVTAPTDGWVVIRRSGSVLKIQKTADGTTFTDVHSYTFSSTADLFINMNLNSNAYKVYYPQGFNLA